MSESAQAWYELESILHSLVANDTTILDALAQMLNEMQQMQARSEESQNKLCAEVRELIAEVRNLNLELTEGKERRTSSHKPVVMTQDEFAGQNPELGLLEYLYSFLTNTNAIDVGANVGRVSERLLKCGYSVYAFEPYDPSFRALRERLKTSQNFHAFDFALGPVDGTMDLHLAADLSGVSKWDPSLFHSLIERPMLQDLQFTQTVPVQVRSLESLRRNGEIPDGAGLLKIDTEGFDLEVMRGMGEGHFSVVMSEFWDSAHPFGRLAPSSLEDLVKEMKHRGYAWHIVIYHLDESSTISYYSNRAQTIPNSWGNAVFFLDHAIFARALRWCEEIRHHFISLIMQRRGLILCCGMIRSASTLQYQVVVELVRQNRLGQSIGFTDRQTVPEFLQRLRGVVGFAVAKAHEVFPEIDSLVQQDLVRPFYTFRDLRAVALSVMRKWEVPFAHLIGRNGWLDTAVESSNYWLSVPGVCVSRYEDVVLSLPAEVTKWAGALGLNITSGQAEELAVKYSIRAQQDRIRAIRIQTGEISGPNSQFDPESLLHHNHIMDGSMDRWKTGLEKWQIRQIEGRFSKWLLDQGYQLTTAVSIG